MASPAPLCSTPARYVPRDPTKTVLYGLVAEQRATFAKVTRDEGGAPSFVDGDDGHYLLRLKSPWRDGTTHLKLEPIELMERLAAQIPKPRINLVLYAGVLAPNAKLRPEVVGYARPKPLPERPATETQTRSERESWAELMRSTFGIDVLACWRCGGRLKYISTIFDPRVARRILEHLRLPARAPPELPASDPPPFWPAAEGWQ